MTQDSRRDGSRAPGDDRPNWGRRILISLAYGIPFLTLLLIAHQGRQLEGCGGSGESGTRHVILVLMDTVRADRLQCLGYSKETTPFLTGAGERLRAFRNAYTTSPWTLPACAALLTGLEPSQHGAGDLGDLANLRTHVPTALREDVPTLASHLLLHGVRTEAYFTNPFLNFGLQRGFETCIDLPDATAVDVVTRFESSLRTWNPDESHFAYLHFMDAHEPLRPDVEDLRALDATSPLPNLPMSWYGMLAMPDELRRRHDWNWSYEASLRRIDRALEHLFTLLDETGRRDDTLVIITADHGEALWDHPREERFWYDQGVLSGTGHGQSFFPELMRIPLLVSWPLHPLEADKLVSLLDIAPTVLDALDLPLPSEVRWNGFSLARWRREDRRLVFEGLSRGRHKRATLDGDGTMFIEAGDTLEPELLARSTFHLEDRIAEDQPARTERRQFLEQASKPPSHALDDVRLPVTEHVQRAAAFGYLMGVRPELVDRRATWKDATGPVRTAVIETRTALDRITWGGHVGDRAWTFEHTDPCFDGGVLHVEGHDDIATRVPPVVWNDALVVLETSGALVSLRPAPANTWERRELPVGARTEPIRHVRVAGTVLVVFTMQNVYLHAREDHPPEALAFAHGHQAVALRTEDGEPRLVLTGRRDRPLVRHQGNAFTLHFPSDHPLRLGFPLEGILDLASTPALPVLDASGTQHSLPLTLDLRTLPLGPPPANAPPGFHMWRDRHVGRTLLKLEPPPGLPLFPITIESSRPAEESLSRQDPLPTWALLHCAESSPWRISTVLENPPLEVDAMACPPDDPDLVLAAGFPCTRPEDHASLEVAAIRWTKGVPLTIERFSLPRSDWRRIIRCQAVGTRRLNVTGSTRLDHQGATIALPE